MKISCPSCSAKYSIADEKVQSRLAKIRCRKCGTSIVIDGNVTPAHVYAADAGADQGPGGGLDKGPLADDAGPTDSGGTVYTVDFGEGDQRQMSVSDLVTAYNSGTVTAQTYLWADGFADWTALAEVTEVVAALHAAAGGIPEDSHAAAARSTAPEETPWAGGAKAKSAAAKGADLFGSYDQAGSEQEVTTSASAAAGTVAPASNPFAPISASTTGARNESSVLFSLSALTSAASTSRPSVPAPTSPGASSNNDDSGLIDLRALTAAAEAKAAPAAPLAPAIPLGGLSPLGSPLGSPLTSPLGVGRPAVAESMPPQSKSNTGLDIIGGSLIVAIIGAAAMFAFAGKEDPAPPAPTAVNIPAPTAAPEPAALPTSAPLPTSDAKPPATGTEGEEPAPGGATAAAKKPSTKKPASGSASTTSAPTPAAADTKPKPAAAPKSKCGCAANDLMCNMKCSSK